jgi:hypothetical protein
VRRHLYHYYLLWRVDHSLRGLLHNLSIGVNTNSVYAVTLSCCYMTFVLHHVLQMPHSMIADAHRQSVDVIAWHPAGHMVGTASHDCILKFWCREPPGSKRFVCAFMCPVRLQRVRFCWCVLCVCVCLRPLKRFWSIFAMLRLRIRVGNSFPVPTCHVAFNTIV